MCHMASKDRDLEKSLDIHRNLTDVSHALLILLQHEIKRAAEQRERDDAQVAENMQKAHLQTGSLSEKFLQFMKEQHEMLMEELHRQSYEVHAQWETAKNEIPDIVESLALKLQSQSDNVFQV